MAKYLKKNYAPIKGKLSLWILAAVLLLGAITTALAYYITQSQPLVNTFSPAQISCQTREVYDGTSKSQITVENTSQIPVYIRVRLVSYWQTPSGSIAGRAAQAPKLDAAALGENWLADTANDTYYYALPAEAGASTGNLLAEGKAIGLITDSEGYIQTVEILAEAVQAVPADAVQQAWNVTVTQSGNIEIR